MPMGQRFKMAVMATFLPIIGLELLSLFLPVYLATNLTILLVSGILIYLAFRQHRRYVLTVIKNIHEGRIDIDQVININIDQLEQDMKESDDLESSYEAVQRQLQDLVDSQQETNSKSHDSNEISDQHSAQDHDPTESASQEDTSPSNDKDDSDSGTKL